ncbi:Pkinase domain-containing protein/S_locus_glycop domain-containing protein/B_lectin domain-containing protein/PAN_2 domain-containing protein [Cephalotus follicularis]|uniref:Receptor-like serine/threonine-protein kinase n=1 Tax=Cephalotus follicularis TaxID=3775 RepID=A0A1Q3ATB9_CEPFO|nr:Pkinase domain-containing protein/S_locus_glycop domain-containing protein/B_lectin domain-containing protein/PAN_2 domain-containing protein [Cephalotus follicularis]
MAIDNYSLLLLYLLSPSLISLSFAKNIPLGSSLYASNQNQNQNWSSPNNIFSLSFIQAIPTTSPPSYLAAITYTAVGGVTVWSAGGAAIDSGGALHFLSTGVLRLVNGSDATLWDSPTANLGVTSASLDDSGNLSLNNGSVPVWSSFENPIVTVIPSQNFTVGKILRSGFYSFSLLRSGTMTLTWNDSVVYWSHALNSSLDTNLTSPTLSLQPNGILSIFDHSLISRVIMAYGNDFGEGSDVFRFLKLDTDGNLRIYSASGGSGTIVETWAAVTDQCQVFGYCGNMGICSYQDSNTICQCPSENFEFIDKHDRTKGCKRKVEIEACMMNATMLKLEHVKFLTYQLEVSQYYIVGISACRSNCLASSSCVALTSMSDGTGSCTMKTPDFISGYQGPALPSTSFVKVCGPAMPTSSPAMNIVGNGKCLRSHAWIDGFVLVSAFLVLITFVGGLWWWCRRNSPKFGGLSAEYLLLEYASGAPVRFSYRELQRSTKDFKEKLGAGGFGAVYRGILVNNAVVAVKQLEGIEQGERQFRMEVATISSTHHVNLVRLIGFCSEGRRRLLVYEFMKNGSLDNFLSEAEEQASKMLNWEYRFNIALGTARGITYLHEECRDCIVHCDIKPENILLDENFNAKVSDFGLAKLINQKEHRYKTLVSVRGTRGYLAPEWLSNFPITSKSDVYSYGMVLLEIVSGRRNFEVSAETNWKKFSTWAYEEFENQNVEVIIDKRLAGQDVNMEQVVRAIQVSFWCIQEQPSMRPMMGKVMQMLEGVMQIHRPPAPFSVTEGSVSGTGVNVSDDLHTFSTTVASAPRQSSSLSFHTAVISPLASAANMERPYSSLLTSHSSRL